MAKAKSGNTAAEKLQVEFKRIEVISILPPDTPARATMNEGSMQELVESMRDLGQLEPITVERDDSMYKIITGHRRFLAARELRWSHIAAMIYPAGAPNRVAMMLHENTVREDMNPAEEALFMAEVREKLQLDEAGLMATFKKSADYIGSRFALLRGDPEVFACLQRAEIRLGVAHELNRITAEDMRRYYLDCARRADPPARVVHQWVESWRAQQQPGLGDGQMTVAGPSAPGGNGDAGAASADPGAPGAGVVPNPQDFRLECKLCGGFKDPYNLVQIWLHKWELEDILNAVNRATKGGTS
jgi:ParB/RepB/Spo0J family partition protein